MSYALRKNLEDILKDGLLPRKPDLIRNAVKGVYLSENPFDWMHTATDGTTKAGAMIEVDVEGLELVKDQNIKAGVCFAYLGCIQPERFVNICVSTDEKPYQFEQMAGFLNKTPESLNVLGYKTIYADPPWNESGGGKIKRGADRHYSLMKTKEIIEYLKQIPIADNAHLYLWVTNNFLPDGLETIVELGFRYVTNIVWVKDRFGLGQYFRGQHELCLFAVKGRLPYKHEDNPNRSCCTEPTVIHAKRQKHSKKPVEMYNKIEAVSYPPFIEVFARERRDGWDAYGNQLSDTQKDLSDKSISVSKQRE